jgi:phage repressor protein C with HTH and peptisase S24 domain
MCCKPNETLGNRLERAIKKKFGSQAKMIRKLGLDRDKYRSQLSEWCRDKNHPMADNLAMLATAGFDINWLLTGRGGMFVHDTPPTEIPVKALAAASEDVTFIDDPAGEGTVRLPNDLEAMQIVGESMSPVLVPGQFAFYSRDSVKDGDLAIIELPPDSNGVVKRYFKRLRENGDHWILVPVNPSPEFHCLTVRKSKQLEIWKVWGAAYLDPNEKGPTQ